MRKKPLTRCLPESLAHWRSKFAREIKLKRAKDCSAFRAPHGHFVQFANKYRTHFRKKTATILWTNVKEIFTTATYRQLMKTTPNWFPICCHQLTFSLRLLSFLQPNPSSCLPSLSCLGLLFKPAKHIKLTLATLPVCPSPLPAGIFISFSVQQLRLHV